MGKKSSKIKVRNKDKNKKTRKKFKVKAQNEKQKRFRELVEAMSVMKRSKKPASKESKEEDPEEEEEGIETEVELEEEIEVKQPKEEPVRKIQVQEEPEEYEQYPLRSKPAVAIICQKILTDPQQHLPLMSKLEQIISEYVVSLTKTRPDPIMQCICLASQSVVFLDLIPGYKIKVLSKEEKEKELKLTAGTLDGGILSRRRYEFFLLEHYSKFLKTLLTIIKETFQKEKIKRILKYSERYRFKKKSEQYVGQRYASENNAVDTTPDDPEALKLREIELSKKKKIEKERGMICLKSICQIIEQKPNFNHTKEVLCKVIPLMNHENDVISNLISKTMSNLFREDRGRDTTYEAVRQMYFYIRQKEFKNIKPCMIRAFFYVPLERAEIINEEEDLRRKKRLSGVDEYSDNATTLIGGKDNYGAAQKTARNRLLTRLRESERFKHRKKHKRAVGMLTHLQAAGKQEKTVGDELEDRRKESMKRTKHRLYAQLIMDVFVTYFSIIKAAEDTKALPVVLEGVERYAPLINIELVFDALQALQEMLQKFSKELTLIVNLRTFVCAFELLQHKTKRFNISTPTEMFYALLYEILWDITAVTDKEEREKAIYLLGKAVDLMFLERRQFDLDTIQSFTHRLLELASYLDPPFSLAVLDMVKRIVVKYGQTLEHGKFWECCTLAKSHHPLQAAVAVDIVANEPIQEELKDYSVTDYMFKLDSIGKQFPVPYKEPVKRSDKKLRAAITEQEEKLFETLRDVLKHFKDEKTTIRVAGGWVRDKILGKKSKDLDIAVDTMKGVEFAKKVNEYLTHKNSDVHRIGVIKSNPEQSKHLETATFVVHGFELDCNHLRKETYAGEGRIPSAIEIGTPKEDAMRRDFKINSLYYNVNHGVIEDYLDGLEDLEKKIIDTTDDPFITFKEDPLRILRAIRFASRLDFVLADRVIKAMKDEAIQLALSTKVSRERYGIEFAKIFMNPRGLHKAFSLIRSIPSLVKVIFHFGPSWSVKIKKDGKDLEEKAIETLITDGLEKAQIRIKHIAWTQLYESISACYDLVPRIIPENGRELYEGHIERFWIGVCFSILYHYAGYTDYTCIAFEQAKLGKKARKCHKKKENLVSALVRGTMKFSGRSCDVARTLTHLLQVFETSYLSDAWFDEILPTLVYEYKEMVQFAFGIYRMISNMIPTVNQYEPFRRSRDEELIRKLDLEYQHERLLEAGMENLTDAQVRNMLSSRYLDTLYGIRLGVDLAYRKRVFSGKKFSRLFPKIKGPATSDGYRIQYLVRYNTLWDRSIFRETAQKKSKAQYVYHPSDECAIDYEKDLWVDLVMNSSVVGGNEYPDPENLLQYFRLEGFKQKVMKKKMVEE